MHFSFENWIHLEEYPDYSLQIRSCFMDQSHCSRNQWIFEAHGIWLYNQMQNLHDQNAERRKNIWTFETLQLLLLYCLFIYV